MSVAGPGQFRVRIWPHTPDQSHGAMTSKSQALKFSMWEVSERGPKRGPVEVPPWHPEEGGPSPK